LLVQDEISDTRIRLPILS